MIDDREKSMCRTLGLSLLTECSLSSRLEKSFGQIKEENELERSVIKRLELEKLEKERLKL